MCLKPASVVQLERTTIIMSVDLSSNPDITLSSDYRGMAKWLGAPYNQEVVCLKICYVQKENQSNNPILQEMYMKIIVVTT